VSNRGRRIVDIGGYAEQVRYGLQHVFEHHVSIAQIGR